MHVFILKKKIQDQCLIVSIARYKNYCDCRIISANKAKAVMSSKKECRVIIRIFNRHFKLALDEFRIPLLEPT